MAERVTDQEVTVYNEGLCMASVCTSLDDDAAIVEAVNIRCPTPTRWAISADNFRDGTPNGSPCNQDPNRRHLLMEC